MVNDWYIQEAKARAKQAGYNPNLLDYADDGVHKLMLRDSSGKPHYFGRLGYRDYIIYKRMELLGTVKPGTAEMMRSRYHKSHSKIKGSWKDNPYSPNMLSLRINW